MKSDTPTSNVEAHESKVKFPGLVTWNRWYRGHRCGKNLNMWEEENRGMKERESEEEMKREKERKEIRTTTKKKIKGQYLYAGHPKLTA